MRFQADSNGQPLPLPCRPHDHATRSACALRVAEALQSVSSPTAAQMAGGDAAYRGETKMALELAVVQAGGAQVHASAASGAATRLSIWPKAFSWWPLGDGRYAHLGALKRKMDLDWMASQHRPAVG
jgi:hypothetical protein